MTASESFYGSELEYQLFLTIMWAAIIIGPPLFIWMIARLAQRGQRFIDNVHRFLTRNDRH